jgi:hypothetical protein
MSGLAEAATPHIATNVAGEFASGFLSSALRHKAACSAVASLMNCLSRLKLAAGPGNLDSFSKYGSNSAPCGKIDINPLLVICMEYRNSFTTFLTS